MHVTVAAGLLKVHVCVNSYLMTKLELNIMTNGWAFQCATHDRVNIGVITAFYGIRICFCCFSLYYLVVKGYLNVTELNLTVGIRAGLYLCFHENVTQHIKVYGMSFIWYWAPCECKYTYIPLCAFIALRCGYMRIITYRRSTTALHSILLASFFSTFFEINFQKPEKYG